LESKSWGNFHFKVNYHFKRTCTNPAQTHTTISIPHDILPWSKEA